MPMYEYACSSCQKLTDKLFTIAERPESIPCGCGKVADFRISAPALIRTTFERNGKIGIRTQLDNGKEIIRSATREKWEHDVGNKSAKDFKGYRSQSVYTKGVQKELDRRKKEKENVNKRRR